MDTELRFHMEAYAEDLVRSGMSTKDAARRARLEFGGIDGAKDECRQARGVGLLEALKQDLRYGSRTLRKDFSFTAMAVLTLALGIGATTAVFSLVNAILLKPLPYPEPDRIAIPWLVSPPGVNLGSEYFPWAESQFQILVKEQTTFQAVAAFQNDSFNLTGSGEPVSIAGFRASAGFFPVFGISPILGRTFLPEEDHPGREFEVVLSEHLWREQFGGDRGILSRPIELNGRQYTVVGVMPAGFVFPRAEEMPSSFNFPREAQLWVPLAIPATPRNGPSELATIGRLKRGLAISQAQADMDIVTARAEAQDARWKQWFTMRVTPLVNQVVGDTRRPLLLILGAVAVVLLIACSNVANLLLTRSLSRRREFTLRAALGAGRGRLVRQLLTESLLLGVVSGTIGVALAQCGIYFVRTFGPANLPRLHEVGLDWPVLAFALGVSLLTGLFFGLAPALGATREALLPSLKETGQRPGGGHTSPKVRSALLVTQVALALVLVVSAGLLIRTFFRLLKIDGGFNPERVLTFQLSLPTSKYTDPNQIVALYRNALERLRPLPGVAAVGVGETVPMGGEGESTVIRIPGYTPPNSKEFPFANYTIVSPGYFAAIGTPLLRGRDFSEADTAESQPVTVINTAMARRYWPGQDVLGKQVGPASPRFPLATVVGVVPDVKHVSLREDDAPEMYVLYNQKPWPSMLSMRIAVRAQADPAAMTSSVRQAIQSIDPDLPLANVNTLDVLMSDSMSQPRFSMLLLGSFGGLAMILAAIGMYGVISYSVMQRTQEIGVRMALGAESRTILGMVVGQGVRLCGLGIAIGLLAAVVVTRLMKSFLYGVQPTDPLTFVGVASLLICVALLACYVPARRATKVDPVIALRYE